MELIAIEMTSTPELEHNFAVVETMLKQIAAQCDDDALVVLPEGFALFGGDASLNTQHREVLGEGPISARLSHLAKTYGVYLAAGTFPTFVEPSQKFQATLAVFDPQGALVADYQKLHLFDVDVTDGTKHYRESDTTEPGQKVVCANIQGITVGLSVCYDVRFGGLYSQMASQGAEIFLVPSAFTVPTGIAHWESLLRARAIEHQAYVVAPAQVGTHTNGRQTYGHSMIIDPWGEVCAKATGDGPSWLHWRFDPLKQAQIKQKMPVKQHNRFISRFNG